MYIFLDTFLVSSISKQADSPPILSDKYREWILECESKGHTIFIPGICYYESLRELEMRQATSQITRLGKYCLRPSRFVPITQSHLDAAAILWGQTRRSGKALADPKALDGDVILCAQVLSFDLPATDYIVATTNRKHLSAFLTCDDWKNIAL
jgi:predicted nucleic acid-binding protein